MGRIKTAKINDVTGVSSPIVIFLQNFTIHYNLRHTLKHFSFGKIQENPRLFTLFTQTKFSEFFLFTIVLQCYTPEALVLAIVTQCKNYANFLRVLNT